MKEGLSLAYIVQSLDIDLRTEHAAALQIRRILESLQSEGHDVTLIASRPGKRVLYSRDLQPTQFQRLTYTDARAFQLVESAARRVQRELRLPWVQIFDSLRLLDVCSHHAHGIDILHERNSMYGIGVAMASRRQKLPYVLQVDADFMFEHDFLGITHNWLEELIAVYTSRINYRAAHAITCVSQVMKDYLISKHRVAGDKIFVIPNGASIIKDLAPGAISAQRGKLGLDGHPTALFVGSFYPWHGVSDLISAFRLVLKRVPDARLVLVGDGETKSSIEAQVRKAGLSDNVVFTGRVPHEEVALMLGLADVAVAPYPKMSLDYWGSPLKVFEYMAMGKAIVASSVGEIRSLLHNGYSGLLVRPGDASAMSEAILDLFSDRELRRRLGEAARTELAREYTWKNYAQRMQPVYEYAINRAKLPKA